MKNPKDYVLTPGGYRPREIVHHIDQDHEVHIIDNRLHKKHKATNDLIPLHYQDGLGADILPNTSGWNAYTYWTNNTGHTIERFSTSWLVPDNPTEDQGTIFFFNGIDPQHTSAGILQPVLQWGPSAAGGGSYWSVANWYVHGDGTSAHSDLLRVNTGDSLTGVMSLLSQSGGQYTYESVFTQYPQLNLKVANLPELVWMNETLETYGLKNCSGYPPHGLSFNHISLQLNGKTLSTIPWTAATGSSNVCQEKASISSHSASDGEIAISFH